MLPPADMQVDINNTALYLHIQQHIMNTTRNTGIYTVPVQNRTYILAHIHLPTIYYKNAYKQTNAYKQICMCLYGGLVTFLL